MKKNLISMTAALIFICSCIIPFTASAETINEPAYPSFEAWKNYTGVDDEQYIVFNYNTSPYYMTFGIRFDTDIVIDDSDEYYINLSSQSLLATTMYYYISDNGNGTYNHLTPLDSSYVNSSVVSININITDKVLQIIENNNNVSTYSFDEYESNIEEIDNSCPLTFTFAPEMTGEVDRSYEVGGVKYYSDRLMMSVTNNSGYNWAYDFTIYDANNTIVYQFLSYEWEDTYDLTDTTIGTHSLIDGSHTTVQLIGSDWHLVQGHASVVQSFYWTQLPLESNKQYTIECYAYKCGTGEWLNNVMQSDFVQNRGEEFINNPIDDYFNENAMLAYTSNFTMLNYDDIVYNHDDDRNGIIPYNSNEDYYKARTSRLATQDSNGNIDYKNYSAYDDPNSWYNRNTIRSSHDSIQQFFEDSKAGKRTITVNNTISPEVNNLFSYSAQYLKLCTSVFQYFPTWFTSLLFAGLLGIIIVALWRKI